MGNIAAAPVWRSQVEIAVMEDSANQGLFNHMVKILVLQTTIAKEVLITHVLLGLTIRQLASPK